MTDNASAGATPVAGGATPPQTPAQPAPGSTTAAPTPATGDDDALGDAGKRAIRPNVTGPSRAEARARPAKRLEELENASKSEHEKALAQAKKDGAPRWHRATRRAPAFRGPAALSAAGSARTCSTWPPGPTSSPSLKVNDEGAVEGLDGCGRSLQEGHAGPVSRRRGRPGLTWRRAAGRAGDGRRRHELDDPARRGAQLATNQPSDRSASDGRAMGYSLLAGEHQ
jgi:hypothetical protein